MIKESRTTLVDLAKLLDLNKATVSAVLSGARTNTRVSQGTRERILKAAADLNYRTSSVASSLKSGRTNMIGYYHGSGTTNFLNDYCAKVLNGLQEECLSQGLELMLYCHREGASVDQIYSDITKRSVDGFVITTSAIAEGEVMARLASLRVPIVGMTYSPRVIKMPYVLIDEKGGLRQIAEHLVERGHKNVWYRSNVLARAETEHYERRAVTFAEICMEYDITVRITASYDRKALSPEERGFLTADNAARPTAVICWNDVGAHHLMVQLASLGMKVPEDIAVIGFDGTDFQVEFPYELTTVIAPWGVMARTATKVLVDMMNGQLVPECTIIPTQLSVGTTS